MNSMLKVDIVLPAVMNREGEVMKEEKVVKAYINFNEILDYFRDDVEAELFQDGRSIYDSIEEREITVVTYRNGYVRYALIELAVFNSLYVKWRNSVDLITIKSKLN